MTSSDVPARSSRSVHDLLGVAENVTFSADPAALFRELLAAAGMTLKNPAGIIAANTRLLWGYAGAFRAAGERAIGRDNPGPIAIARGDKRFADPAYQENPAYFLLAQQYLLFSRLVDELLDNAGVSGPREAKARFAAKFLVDALAPTNTFAGNPAAVRKAYDTGGKSIVRGLQNWVHDLRHNGGWPSQVDSSGFEVGVNMGCHAGKRRLPQRPHRVNPILATDSGYARGSVAVLPAVDQQVLHHGSGAGQKSYRVGRSTRTYVFCDQLP